jgi:hypothetical protein
MAPQVGRGSPPPQHRFRPGQSGNPAGRPKARPSFLAELRDELAEVVGGTDGNKPAISNQRRIIRALLREAIAGDLRAIATVASCVRGLGHDEAEEEAAAPEDAAIISAAAKSNPSQSIVTSKKNSESGT